MSSPLVQQLSRALEKMDRPGSFCTSGNVPAVLPGLEVEGLGPIGLPLTVEQAKKLKKHCELAPYGKGEATLVDPNVRRVWRLKPERFALTSPEWDPFLRQTVHTVRQELGLEEQKLQSHLYELLLYEPGSFFLPHRDGEKLNRMVATLVLVLPSSFLGGELVVRHEGQEQTIDLGSGDYGQFRIHFAAFYADCEHEVRPLRAGFRLCLVYNLTLAKAKKSLAAPRHAEQIATIARILRDWPEDDAPRMLAITLEHQYTKDGLAWDALKGVDRARARVLREAARQADCHVHLALLTLHESGSAEDDGAYGRWYDDEDEEENDDEQGQHEMEEVYESSLTAEHWIDSEGNRLPLGELHVEEEELLDPEALREVKPEEDYEGYTGNEGMTLERWYRHAALFLWPSRRHFEILCTAGSRDASHALELMVKRGRQARGADAAALKAQTVAFAATIIDQWSPNPYGGGFAREVEPDPLLRSLAQLGDPGLVRAYLNKVLAKDAAVDPGKALATVCQKHGWETFRGELEDVFHSTTAATLARDVRLLEHLCTTKPRKKEGWLAVCRTLAQALLAALERIDEAKAEPYDYGRTEDRAHVLAGLARALLATEQSALLARLVAHALARPDKYSLTSAHVAALLALKPWLRKHVKQPCAPLSQWIAACCEQLEALTERAPQAPTDFRRAAALSCKCANCRELSRFLDDPHEPTHRFAAPEDRRRHLEATIRQDHCDVDCTTERRGRPYTLVCTKNTASYQVRVKKFQQDQEHLAALRALQASLP